MTYIEKRIADLKSRLITLLAEGRGEVGVDLQRANDVELTPITALSPSVRSTAATDVLSACSQT